MGSVSWKVLLMEAIEDRGYAKGHIDGYASSRVAGRQRGIAIARRQIAKALLRENILPMATIAKLTDLPIMTIESLLETEPVNQGAKDC